MRFTLFLLLLCAGFSHHSLAQVVSGKVVDDVTGQPLSFVSVVNTNTQQLAYTDMEGAFSIAAAPAHELAISILGYHTQKIKAAQAEERETIQLRRKAVGLNEITVRPNWTPYQADSFARARTYKRTLEYKPSGSVMSPVSALAEVFSKKKKRRQRFQKDFYAMEKERFADTRYYPALVSELTDLQGDSLAQFMNRYPMPYDYARAASDLEIKMWIRNNFKEWEAAGRPVEAALPEEQVLISDK